MPFSTFTHIPSGGKPLEAIPTPVRAGFPGACERVPAHTDERAAAATVLSVLWSRDVIGDKGFLLEADGATGAVRNTGRNLECLRRKTVLGLTTHVIV